MYNKKGEYRKAITDYNTAVLLEPDFAEGVKMRDSIELKLKHLSGSKKSATAKLSSASKRKKKPVTTTIDHRTN
jgi:hypothetical protein